MIADIPKIRMNNQYVADFDSKRTDLVIEASRDLKHVRCIFFVN